MPPKLLRLTVIQNAKQSGGKNWAAVKKAGGFVIVEATTAPKNNADEWKLIQWSGDMGEAVPNSPNRRKLSLAASVKLHVEAKLGGVSDFVDLWVLWATIEILASGPRPTNAAAFDAGMRDNTQTLGAVTYQSGSDSVIDEQAGIFVKNMGAAGKIVAVGTLSPKGVNQIVKDAWTIQRQVWSSNFLDGVSGAPGTNQNWTPDPSMAQHLKLTPDRDDRIYDTDGPDIRWGEFTSETYNRFQQWIEWNKEKCSDNAPWHWNARWKKDKDQSKQIALKDVGKGDTTLPGKAFFPVGRLP
jgi:hypothetical protein